MKRIYLLPLTILISLFLVACGGEGTSSEWRTVSSDSVGISFELPDNWVIEDDIGELTFANDEESLDAEVLQGGGGFVSVEPLSAYGGLEDPITLMGLVTTDLTSDGSLVLADPIRPVTIQGQSAAAATLEGALDDQEGKFLVRIIIANDKLALILGIDGTNEDTHVETLTRILDSMVITAE